MRVEGVHLEVLLDVPEEAGHRVPAAAGPHVRDVLVLGNVAGWVVLPPDVLRQPLEDRGDVPSTERLVDLLHGFDIRHSPLAFSSPLPESSLLSSSLFSSEP